MNKKTPRKSASKWDESSERALLELWTDMMPRLRGCRKNSHILREISLELEKQGFYYTVDVLQTKMHNMTARYRKEKMRMGTGGSPTDWVFYNDMDSLLAPFEGSQPGSLVSNTSMNMNKDTCQLHCKSLRDRIPKTNAESSSESSSCAEVEQNQHRQYDQQMKRLREHMKPQKRIIRSSSSLESLSEVKLDENSKDDESSNLLEERRSQSVESLANDAPVLDAEPPMFFTEHLPTTRASSSRSRKRPKYQADDDDKTITEFLNKMTRILENRYKAASKKEIRPNEGFFAMVQEIFNDLPADVVRNAKFFFINYLRDQMEAIKKK